MLMTEHEDGYTSKELCTLLQAPLFFVRRRCT